jgi:hypothetical protein
VLSAKLQQASGPWKDFFDSQSSRAFRNSPLRHPGY